jgi:uncharacterized protein (TIGR03382 family)
MEFIKNPFATGAAGEDAYLLISASTGKAENEVPSASCLDCAKIKLSAYITVIPVAQTPAAITPPDSGSDSGTTPTDPNQGTQDPTQPGGSTDAGTTLGGCSTAGGTSGALTFLLIGLAAFIRRRK